MHARNIQLMRSARRIQSIQDAADSSGMPGLNPPGVPVSEKPLKTSVPETLDHSLQCNG